MIPIQNKQPNSLQKQLQQVEGGGYSATGFGLSPMLILISVCAVAVAVAVGGAGGAFTIMI